MARRERPATWSQWSGYVIESLFMYVLLLSVVFGMACAIFAIAKAVHNGNAHDKNKVLKIFNSYGVDAQDNTPETRENRKRIAQRILEVNKLYEQKGGNPPVRYDKGRMDKIKAIATTGEPLKLGGTRHWSFTSLWNWFDWTVYLGLYLGATLWFLGFYFNEDRGALANLPWGRRVWPWFLTLLHGPLVWVAMIVSFLMMPRPVMEPQPPAARRDDPVRIPPPPEPLLFLDVLPEEDEDREETTQATTRPQRVQENGLPEYHSSPGVAREIYLQLRAENQGAFRRNRLTGLETAIRETRERIRDCGSEIKTAQQQLGKLQAEHDNLEKILAEIRNSPQIPEEFDRLMELPGVIAVQVVNNHLRVIVRAIFPYKGRLYDLGDWRIDLASNTEEIRAFELRTGLLDPSLTRYPAYRHDRGLFCFGSREGQIGSHLVQGQYLEAIALAVESLRLVSPDHKDRVPATFKEVKQDGRDR